MVELVRLLGDAWRGITIECAQREVVTNDYGVAGEIVKAYVLKKSFHVTSRCVVCWCKVTQFIAYGKTSFYL